MDSEVKLKRRCPCRITVRADRLALSRAAAEELPEYVDLYEYGNLLALRGNLEGKIRLSVGSHKYRQNIRTGKIVDYVCERYGCRAGDVLSAWYRDGVLLFARHVTDLEAQAYFDERFHEVQLPVKAPEKYSLRVRGRTVTLSGAAGALLNDRLSVFERADVLALVPDADGSLWTVPYGRSGGKSIHSEELADYIKEKYGIGETILYGWEKEGAVFFSNRRAAMRVPINSGEYEKLHFEMQKKTVTVNILQNSRLLVSELGAAVLQRHVTLYECGGHLALVSNPNGEFKTVRCAEHSGCDITGRDLVRHIKEKLHLGDEPNCILPAQVRGGAVYFTKDKIEKIPPLRRFEPVEFGRVCELSVISLTVDERGNGKFYISRTARSALKGALSLYRLADVFAFVETPDGTLKMSGSGHIRCKGLAKLLGGEFAAGERRQFYMQMQDGAVFFCRRRFREEEPLNLSRFQRLTGNSTETLVSLSEVFSIVSGIEPPPRTNIVTAVGAALERAE